MILAQFTKTITSILTTLTGYTFIPKVAGRVWSGNRGTIYGETIIVTAESTGQCLLSWSNYVLPVNAIMIATPNLSPSSASIAANIIYVASYAARVNMYNGSAAANLPFSFIT